MKHRWLGQALTFLFLALLLACRRADEYYVFSNLTPTPVVLRPPTRTTAVIVPTTPTPTTVNIIVPTLEVSETPSPPTPTATHTPSIPTPGPDPLPYINVTYKGGALGGVWILTDLRYGIHPGRERVVFEVQGGGSTGPYFELTEVRNHLVPFPSGPDGQMTYDPSWGEARIDIIISDLYAEGFPLQARLPLTPSETTLVNRIGLYPTYDDARLGFSIGLSQPAPYEVTILPDPVRLVIDILNP